MSSRPIQTLYYFDDEIVKINRAAHANRAVLHTVSHMQENTYGADVAEVIDMETGTLHAVVTRNIGKETIEIIYKRPVLGE